jgi:hypothetical protein
MEIFNENLVLNGLINEPGAEVNLFLLDTIPSQTHFSGIFHSLPDIIVLSSSDALRPLSTCWTSYHPYRYVSTDSFALPHPYPRLDYQFA